MRSDRDNFQVDPRWVTGFTDGEGCFTVAIVKNKNFNAGWCLKPTFLISLHVKDNPILVAIKKSLGGAAGKIYKER